MSTLDDYRLPDVLDVLEHRLAEDRTLTFLERHRAHRFLAALRNNQSEAVR
ncbi:hypothetical protein [Mycolicibacterium conceptionense]|uniref:hypothetical protein n=1 Tax=Mycolicibacterium conceptionense TaxID=451644 RepID=UPI000A406B4A|nr:hypothetical protein [Mycolicibacterium conceptionense]